MNTDSIEQLINGFCGNASAEKELQELLGAIAEGNGESPGTTALSSAARFVCDYIRQVPYMITVAWTAACNVGLETEMRQIILGVQSYWDKDNDVIPDHIGIIGLLDDAYCSMCSLQAVSDHYQLQTGKFLFPTDLTTANRAVRAVIGEPYATELDRFIMNTVNDSKLLDAVKSLASKEKQLRFELHETIWNHGSADAMDSSPLAILGNLEPPG